MERETFEIVLPSGIVATLLSDITFGEAQEIEDAIVKNSFEPKYGLNGKMQDVKFNGMGFADQRERKLMIIVKRLVKPASTRPAGTPEEPDKVDVVDAQELPVTMQTINNFTRKDGKALLAACDEVLQGEKKMAGD